MCYPRLLSLLFVLSLCTCVRAQCTVGSVFIESQNELENFADTYQNCPTLNGIIVLGRADGDPVDIEDLTPLLFLNEVLGQFFIRNTQVNTLEGLENLTLPGSFRLQNNDQLETFEGLGDDPITTTLLEIDDCDQLVDIDRLALFDVTTTLVITNNRGIDRCNLPNICRALDNLPDNQTTISGNAGDCATEADVRYDCFLDCHPDMRALADLYDALDGTNWSNQTGWDNLTTQTVCDPCGFFGVGCDGAGRVNSFFTNAEASGQLPASLSRLTELETLNLGSRPNVTGPLPTGIGNLSKLKTLSLTNSGISGVLPASMANLTALEQVRMVNTALTGDFPDVSGWQNLTLLEIFGSNFTGPLPPGLNTIATLETFGANDNNFSGPLYFNWVANAALDLFRVDDNNLDGPLPQWIGDYWRTNVSLLNNNLSGCYPANYVFRCDGAQLGGTFSSFAGNPGLPGGGASSVFLNQFCGDGWLCGVECPSEPVSIGSDAQAAQFKLTYPDCTELPTDLAVNGQGVTSIADLAQLTRVEGSVTINNTLLQSLEDFNVEVVTDFLAIVNNANFFGDVSIADRPLRTVGAALNIRNNSFSSVTRLENLTSVGRLLIANNDNLITLSGLEGITVLEELELDGNDNLEVLSPLNLTTVETLGLINNLRLRDISALAGTTITEELTITDNTSLSACDIASVCTAVRTPTVTKTISGNDNGCLSVAQVEAACPDCHPDIDALMAFYNATGGPNWTDNSGWAAGAALTNCDPCDGSWVGVTCLNDRVRRINLQGNGLAGQLPEELGELSMLVGLTVAINPNLTGPIPKSIFELPNINTIWLRDNNLTGGIPEEVGGAEPLRILTLSGNNNLGGEIPDELYSLKELDQLNLSACGLVGNISNGIEFMNELTRLDLGSNNLEGEYPGEITLLPLLEFIDLSDNELEGEVLQEFANLTALERLDLSDNNLTGELPEDFLAPSVTWLDLGRNFLNGPLPRFIGDLSALTTLGLNNNNFSGCYPDSYANLCSGVGLSFAANPDLPEGGSNAWFNNQFCADPTGACTVFPVSWLSFTARPAGKTVLLNWATAEETDNAGFGVERSADGVEWLTIGDQVAGTQAGEQRYTFMDVEPLPGQGYYRIRQVDVDGSFSHSPVATVTFGGAAVRAWPNPFADALTLVSDRRDVVQLIDLRGRVVAQWAHLGDGAQVQRLVLKPGVYLLRLLGSGEVLRVVAE